MKKYRGAYLKREANIKNVKARLDWLLIGISNPKSIKGELSESLNGQREFSSLGIENSEIQSVSLNTLKSIANEYFLESIDGLSGFAYLDSLRTKLKILVSTTTNTRSSKVKVARSVEIINGLNIQLHQVELLNLQRSKAYFDLFQRVVAIASDAHLPESTRFRVSSIVEDHRALYLNLIGPTEVFGQHNLRVVSGQKNE